MEYCSAIICFTKIERARIYFIFDRVAQNPYIDSSFIYHIRLYCSIIGVQLLSIQDNRSFAPICALGIKQLLLHSLEVSHNGRIPTFMDVR